MSFSLETEERYDDVVTIKEMAEIYADAGSVALTATEPTKDEVRAFNPMRNSALDNSKLKKLGYYYYFLLCVYALCYRLYS